MTTPKDTATSILLKGYITAKQLASELGISPRTLYRWHEKRQGPPRCSKGKLIVYRIDAFHEWLRQNESQSLT